MKDDFNTGLRGNPGGSLQEALPSHPFTSNGSVHIQYSPGSIGRYDHKLREKALLRIVTSAFIRKDPSEVKILDMGCGRGELLRILRNEGFKVFGMDVDPNCVRMAGQYSEAFQGDYSAIAARFPHDHFDMVISSHSLEHLENPKKDLLSLVRVSKRFVLVAVPNPLTLPNVVHSGLLGRVPDVNRGHHYVWDHRHLKNFLENHADLRTISWHGDFIRIFPRKMGIRRRFAATGLIHRIESASAKVFPFLSDSIIALCEKKAL